MGLSLGGLYVTTVTDIEVIVKARHAILVKVGMMGHKKVFFQEHGQVRDWNSAGQGVNN